jgi:hypothetical protein
MARGNGLQWWNPTQCITMAKKGVAHGCVLEKGFRQSSIVHERKEKRLWSSLLRSSEGD